MTGQKSKEQKNIHMKHGKIKISLLLASALLIAPVQMSYSQEAPTAEKMAGKRSAWLKDALSLTDKQYKKVYDIVLAEENARKEYIEKKRAEFSSARAEAENAPAQKTEAPDAAVNGCKPMPPEWCPYRPCPEDCYYGGPRCCPAGKGYAAAPHGMKPGKGLGTKGYGAPRGPRMAGMHMGIDSIKSEYSAKIIGVLSAEQTEKYLLLSRTGERPVPPAYCGTPYPRHGHGRCGR